MLGIGGWPPRSCVVLWLFSAVDQLLGAQTPELHSKSPSLVRHPLRAYCNQQTVAQLYDFALLQVLPCSKRYCHDWTTCPFAHPGQSTGSGRRWLVVLRRLPPGVMLFGLLHAPFRSVSATNHAA